MHSPGFVITKCCDCGCVNWNSTGICDSCHSMDASSLIGREIDIDEMICDGAIREFAEEHGFTKHTVDYIDNENGVVGIMGLSEKILIIDIA